MHELTKLALGIAMLGGTIAAAHATVTTATTGTDRAGHYNAHQPCYYYVNLGLPGPKRCYRFFSNALGPDVYMRYGFIFRSHDSFVRFRNLGWFKQRPLLAAKKKQVRLAAKEEQVQLAARAERAQLAAKEIRARNEMRQRQVRLSKEKHRAARVKEFLLRGHAMRQEMQERRIASRQTPVQPEEQVRLAAREDHNPAGKEDHLRQRDQARQSEETGQHANRDEEDGSGGASRGDVARDSSSGGASRGTTVYPKAESGGAGHGEHVHEGDSGGASGY